MNLKNFKLEFIYLLKRVLRIEEIENQVGTCAPSRNCLNNSSSYSPTFLFKQLFNKQTDRQTDAPCSKLPSPPHARINFIREKSIHTLTRDEKWIILKNWLKLQ